MRTISAKNVREALAKAKGIGLCEESFVLDDCEIVVRNLRPDEYESIIADCTGLDDTAYVWGLQKGHIARAICEINGLDFRDTAYIEVEDTDPKNPERVKTLKLEPHVYIRDRVLNTWSKEALFVAFRKVYDVVAEAENKSRNGITFRVAEENAEEKYRRIMAELREAEDDLPPKVIENVLAEYGYMRRTNADVESRLDAAVVASKTVPQRAPEPAQAPEDVLIDPQPVQGDENSFSVKAVDPVQLMRERIPMTRSAQPRQAQPAPRPAPVPQPAPQRAEAQPPRVGYVVGDGAQQRVVQAPSGRTTDAGVVPTAAPIQPSSMDGMSKAARRYAAIEAEADPHVASLLEGSSMALPQQPLEQDRVPVLSGNTREFADPDVVKQTIDLPPVVGINPRYKPQNPLR